MQQQFNPHEPDFTSAIMHGQDDDREYARFYTRYLAMAIDGFIVTLAMGLIQSSGLQIPAILLSLLSIAYYMFLPTRLDGQTLGKKLLGIQIISTSGQELGFRQMFLREGPLKLLSFLLLGYG